MSEQKTDQALTRSDQPQPGSGDADPRGDDRDDFEDYDLYDSDGCQRCGGSGVIVVCIDDMCHGAGECMHGDGEIACPDCGGI